jgi:ribosomal protein S26
MTVRLDVSEDEWRRRNQGREPQGRGNVPALRTRERNKRLGRSKTTLESRVQVQTVGLNAETKKIGTEPKGRCFS